MPPWARTSAAVPLDNQRNKHRGQIDWTAPWPSEVFPVARRPMPHLPLWILPACLACRQSTWQPAHTSTHACIAVPTTVLRTSSSLVASLRGLAGRWVRIPCITKVECHVRLSAIAHDQSVCQCASTTKWPTWVHHSCTRIAGRRSSSMSSSSMMIATLELNHMQLLLHSCHMLPCIIMALMPEQSTVPL